MRYSERMLERLGNDEPERLTDNEKLKMIERLFELRDELDIVIDVEEEDVENILGEDDTDFLTNLTTLAVMNGFDPEDFFELLGMPARFKKPSPEKTRSTMIIDGTLGQTAMRQLENIPEQE